MNLNNIDETNGIPADSPFSLQNAMMIASTQAFIFPNTALADETVAVTTPSLAAQGGKWFFVAYIVVSLLAGFKELFTRTQKALNEKE